MLKCFQPQCFGIAKYAVGGTKYLQEDRDTKHCAENKLPPIDYEHHSRDVYGAWNAQRPTEKSYIVSYETR